MSGNKEIQTEYSSETNGDENNRCQSAMEESIFQLDMDLARLEQCGFDSLNTTDQVMIKLQEAMQQMEQVMAIQSQCQAALEMCCEDGRGPVVQLLEHSKKESGQLEELVNQLHLAMEAGVEANDAARSIEAIIADQSEHIKILASSLTGLDCD